MHWNIADLFESLADAIPERVALVSGKTRHTFAALDARANRLAHALLARGVSAGDHVGFFLYNGAEFIEAMLACFKIRAVPININYRYVEAELAFLCSNADLVAILFQRELGPLVQHVRNEVPTMRLLVSVDEGSDAALPAGAVDFEALLAEGKDGRGFAERSGDDLYVIYTGGTTGMPRGVMWRQEDVFFAGLQGGNPGGSPLERPEQLAENAAAAPEGMNMLPAAPFIHGAAQWGCWIGMFTGGKVVISPGRSFDARDTARLVEEEKVNTITLVGDAMAKPLSDALAERPYDTSSLMVIASAGAVLSRSIKERLAELLPSTMVLNNFGATETGHQGSIYPSEETGKLSFFMDDTNTVLGEDLKPIVPGSGVIGKLARTGRLPLGYYKDPAKTAATFLVIDGKRWVVPGDLATLEEDGRITVFGRGAVCINTGGEKVFPEEVEEALKAHPDVADALVVGIPDERFGQRVAAVVQPREGAATLTLDGIVAHCRKHVAGYKVPRELTLVAKVLRHPSGKPDYGWAKQTAMAGGAS